MTPVVTAWVAPGGGARFETHVPLRFNLRRARARGWRGAVDLVLLYGRAELPAEVAAELADLGVTLRDGEASFRAHAARHAALGRFGEFERACFLRWLVLADLYAGAPLLHFDGDVIFNADPAELARRWARRTFVLQGCPAVTALHDGAWGGRYAAELGRFAGDVDGYSAAAWAEREGWEETARTRWAGYRDRRTISSDQDLISHLLHTGRLPQARPDEVRGDVPELVLFENPLLLGSLAPERPLDYRRAGGVDFLGGRQVAVWHMQTDWCRYLAKIMWRERLGPLAGMGRLSFGRKDRETLCSDVLRKLSGGRWHDRAAVCRRFFAEGDFSAVFRAETWWEAGVF